MGQENNTGSLGSLAAALAGGAVRTWAAAWAAAEVAVDAAAAQTQRLGSVAHGSAAGAAVGAALGRTLASPGAQFWFGLCAGLLLGSVKLRARARRHEQTAAGAPGETPGGTPGETPDGTPGETPGGSPGGAPDSEAELVAAQARLAQAFKGLVTSSCIYVCETVGLYSELSARGPGTSRELAARTGLDERFMRELLLQGTAAGVLTLDFGSHRFSIPRAFARLLVDPRESKEPASMAGLFQWAPAIAARIASTVASLQTGRGEPYDGPHKEDIALAIATMHLPFANHDLLGPVLHDAALGGLAAQLARGGLRVAEVGCGAGDALCAMAERFPECHFDGFELSHEAIRMTQANIARRRLANARVLDVAVQPLDREPACYDFVLCFDVIHDCTQPLEVLRAVRRALKPGALFLCIDIEAFEDAQSTVEHPSAEMRLGISCAVCLHSGASEPGGAALGTMGLHPALLTKLAREAGFRGSVDRFLVASMPTNSFHVLHP
jgi:2-polyprenyl-3-methyl-5-hydroxy-6-metoxy-1,4-benzoquinol methylase